MTELEGNRKGLKCETCEACPRCDMIWLLHFFFSSFPLPTTFYSNFISKTHLQILITHPFAKTFQQNRKRFALAPERVSTETHQIQSSTFRALEEEGKKK